jgi:tungstate transport system ATP-binding protein
MSDPIFELTGVRQVYEGREVLHVEHLQIWPGEILAVVGPSGAGKSTLLRLLNFLETPASGQICYKGRAYREHSSVPVETRREITTVFQDTKLLDRSVHANVRYGLALRGARKEDQVVEAALEQVGLRDLARQRASKLSGGETQRVALARAIVLQPEVLLLDEPTANLDPFNVGLMEQIIQRRNRSAGTTMIVVTHNTFQARRLAHRVMFLLSGQVVEVNESEAFFNRPRDPRTRAFVEGEMIY